MPKNKDDIIKVLELVEQGNVEAITALEDKTDFVSGLNAILKQANKDAKDVKSLTDKVTKLETDNSAMTNKFNKLSDHIGLTIADGETVESIDKALKKIKEEQDRANNDKSDAEKTIATLNGNMAQLKSQISEHNRIIKEAQEKNANLEKRIAEEIHKRQDIIRDLAVKDALIANEAVSPEYTARLFMGNVKVRDDDTTVFTDENGTELTVEEGIKSFLDKNPVYRQNNQITGAGGGNSFNSGSNIDYENIDPSEYRKLRAEGKIK